MKILAIDDEQDILNIISHVTKMLEVEYVGIDNFEEFKKQDVDNFDVIVIDLFLSGHENGIEILRYLSAEDCKARIIIMTGVNEKILDSSVHLARELKLNIVGTLKKPFSLAYLKKVFSDAISYEETNKKTEEYESKSFTERDILDGIKNKEFYTLFQPQYKVDTLELYGVEVLIRWKSKKLGELLPGDFIPKIEKLGYIDVLTDYVVETSFKEFKEFRKKIDKEIHISINISPISVTNLEIPEKISDFADKYEIPYNNITIEITEGTAIDNLKNSLDSLNRFRIKGFNLSIDDFGTGHSSLAQLMKIPFSEIKIDRSFIGGLLEDSSHRVITKLSILMAHELGMTVVAEGIESMDVLEELRKLNCNYAQGYLLGKPMKLGDIKTML